MVGITERGDASNCYIEYKQENLLGEKEVFKWEPFLNKLDFAILITKNVTDDFIEAALRHTSKALIHATVTGMGGSALEPNVLTKEKSLAQIKKLIGQGFPVEQIVLRIDPIIPNKRGIETATQVIELFKGTGIKRIRYSFMDIYPHVKERFLAHNINLPYNSFKAPEYMLKKAKKSLHKYDSIFCFESCAESFYDYDAIGCISEKDYKIMGVPFAFEKANQQRRFCLCVNKKELLDDCIRCPNQCLYCYWRDKE